MLKKEQKLDIIGNRIIIIEGTIYNLELAIQEEEAKSIPSESYIQELNFLKSENLMSLEAMNNQLDIVSAE